MPVVPRPAEPDHPEPPHRQGPEDGPVAEQRRLDHVVQEDTSHRGGDEGERDVTGQPETVGVPSQDSARHLHDARPVEAEHRQDGAALDEDQVGAKRFLRLRPIQVQERRGQDQMPRRAHREVFGDALHQPQHDRLPPDEHVAVLPPREHIRGARSVPAAHEVGSILPGPRPAARGR